MNQENDNTILDNLMKDIKDDNIDEKVNKICDKIQEEEDNKKLPDEAKFRPDYPNIFLVLEVNPVMNDQFNYLTLEREIPGKYIIGLWSKKKYFDENEKPVKRINSWEIKESKPEKIIKEYAKVLKIYR